MKTSIAIFILALLLIAGAAVLFAPSETLNIENIPPIQAILATPQKTTLLFTGDIMLDRSIRKQIETSQDPLYPFLRIAEVTRSADLMIGNLEGPISARGIKVGSIYSFRFEPVGTINALKYAGFDVLSIANNHIWDYGREALLDTLEYLDGAGIGFAGAGRNEIEANASVIKTVGETAIAFFSYTTLYPKSLWADSENPGISRFELDTIKRRVAAIKESSEADLTVAIFHWGEEYQTKSNAAQQEIAHALIDAGADLIVGHHPHVGQEIEEYKGKYIAYSLGNFVFDQNFSTDTRKGLMLKVELEGKHVTNVTSIPIVFTDTYQPYMP